MNDCRLIYRSKATTDIVSNATLLEIESQAAVANAKNGITGALVLSGNEFLQAREGPSHSLTSLFGRIIEDRRHHRVELITFEPIAERLFDAWYMRLVDLYDLPRAERAWMAARYPAREGCIAIPDDGHGANALLLDVRQLFQSLPWRSSSQIASSQALESTRAMTSHHQ
mgnify:CR=1 FL=1